MNKKSILIITTLILSISLISCSNTTKKVVISENTQKEIFVEESQANEAINTGKKLLADKKYDEAKAYFNKALTLDKSNKELYIKIKNIYIDNNRLDDAYFIIKTAIANNIDNENMKLVAKEISSKFEVITINKSIYQDTLYNLPQDIDFNINGETLSLPIIWNIEKIDNIPGNYTYYGTNEEYGRQVVLNLTILENIYDTEIGYINKVYTIDGKIYIDVDLVEFFTGREESLNAAIEDNVHIEIIDGYICFPYNYYVRDNYDTITTYELTDNCNFKLLQEDFDILGYSYPHSDDVSTPTTASFEDFAKLINIANTSSLATSDKGYKLFWIEIKNDTVYSIYKQFTP